MRTYGRFFAEFLNVDSPVRLTLLELPICFDLRYGHAYINLRSFSWETAFRDFPSRRKRFSLRLDVRFPDFPWKHPYGTSVNSITRP